MSVAFSQKSPRQPISEITVTELLSSKDYIIIPEKLFGQIIPYVPNVY